MKALVFTNLTDLNEDQIRQAIGLSFRLRSPVWVYEDGGKLLVTTRDLRQGNENTLLHTACIGKP